MFQNRNPNITYFAKTLYQSQEQVFGIRQSDRCLHCYLLGQTGVGKSSLLKNMMIQDAIHGRGFTLIEPHGSLVESVRDEVFKYRKDDLIYLDVTDPNLTLGYNPIRRVSYEKRALLASSILDVLKKLWFDSWGTKLEHLIRFTLLALLDQKKANFENILDMHYDKEYRKKVLENVVSDQVKKFWKFEYKQYSKFDLVPIYNKLGAFLSYSSVRRVLVENEDNLSLRKIMDESKILLVNVAKGHIGQDPSHILGALLVTSLTSAAFTRIDTPENDRVPHHIYLDEFQSFSTLSLINSCSELRKFSVSLTLANQYTKQLSPDILHAVIGNVGTKIIFRLGHTDASVFANEMKPYFEATDFMHLPNRHIYLTLMIDGRPSNPFSAVTI